VAPPPPPELYGLGFYGAIDAGANVYQDRGGTKVFSDEFGDTLTIDPKNDVGFFGGLKLGYVFGTGVFRPTVEGDFFYNGFRGGANFTLRDPFGDVVRSSSLTTWINTGAFMGNFIARFAFGRFQPYVGAGLGITMRNPLVPSSKGLMAPLTLAEEKVTRTSRGRLLPAQITIGLRSSAPSLSTTSSIIRAPKSIPMKLAIWGSNWLARA